MKIERNVIKNKKLYGTVSFILYLIISYLVTGYSYLYTGMEILKYPAFLILLAGILIHYRYLNPISLSIFWLLTVLFSFIIIYPGMLLYSKIHVNIFLITFIITVILRVISYKKESKFKAFKVLRLICDSILLFVLSYFSVKTVSAVKPLCNSMILPLDLTIFLWLSTFYVYFFKRSMRIYDITVTFLSVIIYMISAAQTGSILANVYNMILHEGKGEDYSNIAFFGGAAISLVLFVIVRFSKKLEGKK